MEFYRPGKDFPALSVTGTRCQLNCPHCEGKYLGGMKAVETPDELYRLALELDNEGRRGFLLSGGCDTRGRVPVSGYLDVIHRIKDDTALTINLHTGWIDEETAGRVDGSGVDVVSYDIIGSEETIRSLYGVDIGPEYILEGYRALRSFGVRVVPHITIGLDKGVINGEFEAVDMVSDSNKLIINSLIPSKSFGRSVSDDDLISVLEYAREVVDGKIILGCMRERGRADLEISALEMGIDGIVMPSKKTVEWSKKHSPKWYKGCCAVYT